MKKLVGVFAAIFTLVISQMISASAVDMVVDTGITHNWVLPVVLICVALLVIVVLILTKNKKSDK